MITHDTFYEDLRLGSLVVYHVWEKPFGAILEEARYYWHDKNCEESIGPYSYLSEAMADYAKMKREEKSLQLCPLVQELQGKKNQGGSTDGLRSKRRNRL